MKGLNVNFFIFFLDLLVFTTMVLQMSK